MVTNPSLDPLLHKGAGKEAGKAEVGVEGSPTLAGVEGLFRRVASSTGMPGRR